MIVVHAKVTGHRRHRDELLELLRDLAEHTRTRDEGCIDYRYHVDVADDTRFICVEVWRDEAALRAHLAAPHMNDPHSRFTELTCGPEDVSIWRATPIDPAEFT